MASSPHQQRLSDAGLVQFGSSTCKFGRPRENLIFSIYDDSESGDDDLPPWMTEDITGGSDDPLNDPSAVPLDKESRRRSGNRRVSTQKRRREGVGMSLSHRGRVASAGARRHYADDSGHTDGGPYATQPRCSHDC